jgi:hypothetical protein
MVGGISQRIRGDMDNLLATPPLVDHNLKELGRSLWAAVEPLVLVA